MFDTVEKFSLLNVEGKREIIHNLHQISNIIVSILFFGNPSQSYIKGLTEVLNDLLKLIFLQEKNSNVMFPIIHADKAFIGILTRFNKLQQTEDKYTRTARDRLYKEDSDSESDSECEE